MARHFATSHLPKQSGWTRQQWLTLLFSLLVAATTVSGGGAHAQAQGAPINVTPGATVPTVLRTIVIDENNATETGDANIPLSVTIGTTTYTYGIQLGTVDLTEDGSTFSDRLLFQINPDTSAISVHVTSDTNVGEASPAEVETYRVQNGNFIMMYEISSPTEMPEPGTLILLVTGIAGLFGFLCRKALGAGAA